MTAIIAWTTIVLMSILGILGLIQVFKACYGNDLRKAKPLGIFDTRSTTERMHDEAEERRRGEETENNAGPKHLIPFHRCLFLLLPLLIQTASSLMYIFGSSHSLRDFVIFGVAGSVGIAIYVGVLTFWFSCKVPHDASSLAVAITSILLLPLTWFVVYAVSTTLLWTVLVGSTIPFTQ